MQYHASTRAAVEEDQHDESKRESSSSGHASCQRRACIMRRRLPSAARGRCMSCERLECEAARAVYMYETVIRLGMLFTRGKTHVIPYALLHAGPRSPAARHGVKRRKHRGLHWHIRRRHLP